MDAPYLLLRLGRGYENEGWEEGWKRSAEALSLIRRHAASLGITCLLEYPQRSETDLVSNLCEMPHGERDGCQQLPSVPRYHRDGDRRRHR
jgi:hypothetical protein